jgi:hypothetical protein
MLSDVEKLRQDSCESRPEWHEAILGKLRVTNAEQAAFEVDIALAQAGDFSDPQAKGVHHGEDEVVALAAVGALRPIRKRRCKRQETLGQQRVEQERARARLRPSGPDPYRRVLEALLDDEPREEAADDAQKVVVATCWLAVPRGEKRLDKRRGHRRHVVDRMLAEVAVEQEQCSLLGRVLAAKGTLVLDVSLDVRCENALA